MLRRLQDFRYYYKADVYSSTPLRVKDLKEFLRCHKKQRLRNSCRVEEHQKKAIAYCKKSLDYCITHHQDPLAHINRGLFDYLEGNVIEALERINALLKKAKAEELDSLKAHALLLKGRSELEAALYTDAILTLTELIGSHPDNKDAYLERAEAYFELGDFDASLDDYLNSGIKSEPIPEESFAMLAFAASLREGIGEGGAQACIEFLPSLLSSLQGLSHGLWAFAQDPVPISKGFIQASQDCILFIKEHTVTETLLELAPEIKNLIEQWDLLKEGEKGKLTGQIIGKYGVEIFSGAGIAKAMKVFRELKKANNLMTFEAMAISERNKSFLKLESAKKAQVRKEVLQYANLTIQPDKQGKHLPNHPNYTEMKSILEHPNSQKLVSEFAGKGMKEANFPPGTPGYREVVNFKKFIGYDIDPKTGKQTPTTWGKIHYAKDGTHIVPTKPRE